MGFGVKIVIEGDFALFSRPEMKVERVSYDVPTPSALIGLLSSVYWHPGIKYVIDKIIVYNPINFINIRRNEVKEKISFKKIKHQMDDINNQIEFYTSEERSQRASLLLKNVKYGVEAHFEITKDAVESLTKEKVYNILKRRLENGQYFIKPCLGCREFPAKVCYVEELPQSDLNGEVDLGFMLYDLVYDKSDDNKSLDSANPRFYRPRMIDGVIDVQKYVGDLLC